MLSRTQKQTHTHKFNKKQTIHLADVEEYKNISNPNSKTINHWDYYTTVKARKGETATIFALKDN